MNLRTLDGTWNGSPLNIVVRVIRLFRIPTAGDVPPFAVGRHIDLLAYRGEEKVVVLVYVNRRGTSRRMTRCG